MNEKKCILFVDNDQDILKLISAKLSSQKDNWQVVCVEDGYSALELMQRNRFDAVVSDIEMPRMTGVELLDRINRKYPHTVRILLSGQTNKDVSSKSIAFSHQYLRKPRGIKELKSILKQAFALQDLLCNKKVQELVTKQGSLPSLPITYTKLMEEIETKEPNFTKIGKIISGDVSMTANILKLVNSAYFGFRVKVSNPTQAVKFLGLNTIRSLVLTYGIFTKFSEVSIDGFNVESILSHSIVVGGYAKAIAKAETESESHHDTVLTDSMIAGMLHDIGKLVLSLHIHEEYTKVIKEANQQQRPLWNVENQKLGTTHAEVGAYLLGIWGLPGGLVEAVGFHHKPNGHSDLGFRPLTSVYAANLIYYTLNQKKNKKGLIPDATYLEKLGLNDRIAFWKEQCEKLDKFKSN